MSKGRLTANASKVVKLYAERPHERKHLEDALEYLHFVGSLLDFDLYDNDGVRGVLAATQDADDGSEELSTVLAGVRRSMDDMRVKMFVAQDIINARLEAGNVSDRKVRRDAAKAVAESNEETDDES